MNYLIKHSIFSNRYKSVRVHAFINYTTQKTQNELQAYGLYIY